MLKQSQNIYIIITLFFFFFVKLSAPRPSLTRASAVPEKPSTLNPSLYLKQWLLSSKAADKTTIRTMTAGVRTRLRISPETASPDKRAQMVKMLSALEELHRTFNSTLSSRITIMPRGTDILTYWSYLKDFMGVWWKKSFNKNEQMKHVTSQCKHQHHWGWGGGTGLSEHDHIHFWTT